jgi:hypothetical protein
MIKRLKLSASAAALMLLVGGAMSSVQAADYVEPGCTLSGSVMAGFMYNWQELEFSINDGSEGFDIDWSTPFGEGAGLVTCGAFNIQADVAYYAHSGDVSEFSSDVDVDQTNTHIGGVLFYREPSSWAGGLQASWISRDISGIDLDVFRVGLFGEFYLDDVFTLGASAHYYNADWPTDFTGGQDEDGFQGAVWGRFYATPDLSLMLRGDLLLATIDNDFEGKADWDGFAITGEGEYLVWDQGLSLFAGARYAERELDADDADDSADIDDFQVYGGVKFSFGQGGTLLERQRTGPVDNTSVFDEKLPFPTLRVQIVD